MTASESTRVEGALALSSRTLLSKRFCCWTLLEHHLHEIIPYNGTVCAELLDDICHELGSRRAVLLHNFLQLILGDLAISVRIGRFEGLREFPKLLFTDRVRHGTNVGWRERKQAQ